MDAVEARGGKPGESGPPHAAEPPAKPGRRRQRGCLARLATSRTVQITLVVVLLVAVAIGTGYYLWWRSPQLELALLVVDKTVPFEDKREHRGLFWLLEQHRFVDGTAPAGEERYEYTTDYTGFFPVDPPEEYDTSLLSTAKLADRDVLYLADTYGVYWSDYEQFEGRDWAATEHSPKIFGGLEEQEVEALEFFAAQEKLIIGEFNCFASPTPPDLRERTENIFGVRWTRWVGRYFLDLADEKDVPAWLYRLYQEKYGREWDVEGSGYILCRDESTEFIILKDGEDIRPEGITLEINTAFADGDVMQGVRDSKFNYWFDILTAQPGAEILAEYQMHLTPAGEEKVLEAGLPLRFPAVVRKQDGYSAYYLAGDFVDFDKAMGPPVNRLTLFINRDYYKTASPGGQGCFFWHTYFPLVSNILRQYSNELHGKPEKVYLY
jgi:hypothetical protein